MLYHIFWAVLSSHSITATPRNLLRSEALLGRIGVGAALRQHKLPDSAAAARQAFTPSPGQFLIKGQLPLRVIEPARVPVSLPEPVVRHFGVRLQANSFAKLRDRQRWCSPRQAETAEFEVRVREGRS